MPPVARSRDDLAADLSSFGMARGDVVYLRASLRALGPTLTGKPDAFLGAVLDVLGPDGVLVAPAFTRQYPVWRRNIPFADMDNDPTTGGLACMMLNHPGAVRSAHPTHSFVAIGTGAKDLLAGHTHDTACFHPLRNVIKASGKLMLVGCVAESPGFSTVHLAQHDLGLSQRHFLRLLYHVKIRDKAGERQFVRNPESPGCSRGFGRFYADHVAAGNLQTGHVGAAWSVWADAAKAYEVEAERLSEEPRYVLCSRKSCVRCRLVCGYNLRAAPMALLRNMVTRGPSLASQLWHSRPSHAV